MKSFHLVVLLSAIVRGAQYTGLKFKVDLAKTSMHVNAETNDYFMCLEKKGSGELYFVNLLNEPIRADSVPDTIHLQTARLGPLGKLSLLTFISALSVLIDWDSFVASACKDLTPTELMNLPKSIWADLSLNQIAMLLGKIPDDKFVIATIIRLEREGKPVHEISTDARMSGTSIGVSEGAVVPSGGSIHVIRAMKMTGSFSLPFNLKVERKLFQDNTIVSQGQLLYVFSKQ